MISLWALLALDDFKFNVIALLQALVTLRPDRAVVNENIWAVVASDESEPLSIVEPLYLSFNSRHFLFPPYMT